MATWHKGVCSHQKDTDLVARPQTHSRRGGEGRRTSRVLVVGVWGLTIKQLLSPTQRWQYFHSVEPSHWILSQWWFPFWWLSPKTFPPRCSLKAQPKRNTQGASLDRLLPAGAGTHLGQAQCEAGAGVLGEANVQTLQCSVLQREKRSSRLYLVERNGCGSSCVFICTINTWNQQSP